jgi:DNA-binding LacI/PurR family transcriptional regulator
LATTIRDVAKKAGVGIGTVSRVLNNSPEVSQITRERVLAAITALNYHPNPTARRLALGRTHTIGVIVPFLARPGFVGRLGGIQAELASTEYNLILFNVNAPEKRDDYLKSVSKFKQVDGMVILSLGVQDEHVDAFEHWQVPVVLLDVYHPRLPSVVTDDENGGRIATEHLISEGHRHIAYVGDNFDNPFGFISSHKRYLGYRRALETAEIPFRPEYCRQGEHGRYIAHQLTLELLALSSPPTAIFAASDTQALGVMEAIASRDLRVPEDISVIGYDDIEIAEYLNLTTVHQPMYRSGQQAIMLLLDLIADRQTELHVVLPVKLVQRRTTGPPPSN